MDLDTAEDLSVFDTQLNECPSCGRVRLRFTEEPAVHMLCPDCIDRAHSAPQRPLT